MARDSSGRGGGREHEAERDDEGDHDAEDAGTPGRAINRAERLLGMGVIVMAMIVAVVVEGVMRDGSLVTGCVGVVRAGRHRPVNLRRSFWQTIGGVLNP
jgi:hypothetical protein